MLKTSPVPGSSGDRYVPFDQRTGDTSVVYFTRDLSAQGLVNIFRRVGGVLTGNVAVKVHTGEQHGPNIIPRSWVKALMEQELPGGTIVETNTYYDGDRYTTEKHRKTLQVNGWTFCPVDILDEEGTAMFPIRGGKWFDEMSVGGHLANYDSFLALTHFKGHTMGGFGGSNKNIGIGCADGRVGKGMIHTVPGDPNLWSIAQEEFMERMTESAKSVVDHFGGDEPLLARAMAKRLGLPAVPTLVKARHTQPQSGLDSAEARRANALGAYALLPGADVAGRHVLLADDVVTSGATLSECARTLLEAGAAEVWCVTLAQARPS